MVCFLCQSNPPEELSGLLTPFSPHLGSPNSKGQHPFPGILNKDTQDAMSSSCELYENSVLISPLSLKTSFSSVRIPYLALEGEGQALVSYCMCMPSTQFYIQQAQSCNSQSWSELRICICCNISVTS